MRVPSSDPSRPKRRRFGAYLAALPLAVVGVLSLAGGAQAQERVRIVAPKTVETAGKVPYATEVSGAAERVTFFVDGRRRWVDASPQRQFNRSGYLPAADLGNGSHKLAVTVKRRDGSLLSAKHMIYVSHRSATEGRSGKSRSEPTPAPEPNPAPAPASEPAPSPPPAPSPAAAPAPAPTPPLLDAGFENGLANWSTAGVGDVVPAAVTDTVRSGAKSAKVILSGSQSRSELILGGDGGGSANGVVHFEEGEERYYGFSFYIESMVYGKPGAHNLVMQFKSNGEGSPNFGLQLWDYKGKRGLWSHSDAMDGDRFLSPVSEHAWHDVVIHFKASRQDAGFYEIYLDGQQIDSRSGVSMIRPDRSYAYIKNGLYRNGGNIPGTSEIRLDAARLGMTWSSVVPG